MSKSFTIGNRVRNKRTGKEGSIIDIEDAIALKAGGMESASELVSGRMKVRWDDGDESQFFNPSDMEVVSQADPTTV